MTGEFYADQARRYATYCRSYGENKLYKIACGPNTDDYRWMDAVMKSMVDCPNCPAGMPPDRFINGVSVHYYSVAGTWENKGKALDSDTDSWLDLMEKSWRSEELIIRHKAIMDRYDPGNKIGMIFDEWGTWHQVEQGTNPGLLYQQNTIRDALVASMHLDIFHKHADRVYMANLAQAINVLQAPILTKDDQMVLTPTYHVLEMNKGHMDGVNLPVFLNDQLPTLEFDNRTFPSISMSASRKKDGYLLSVTNLDPQVDNTMAIDLRGVRIHQIKGRLLTAERLNSCNDFGSAENVRPQDFSEFTLDGSTLKFTLPAHSFVTFVMG
jgi:alpha-N-arabinofuranosidase